jgi:hypothetical protein
MRENRLYGSEGGGALTRSPYPYRPGWGDSVTGPALAPHPHHCMFDLKPALS